MEMKQIKAEIKDYVRDHYKYYGWYPYDVQVGDVLYTYEQYMDILSMTVQKLSTLSCNRVRMYYNVYMRGELTQCSRKSRTDAMPSLPITKGDPYA